MSKQAKIITMFFVVLALGAGNVWAEIIEINITAEIAQLRDPYGLLKGQLIVGDIITGSYIYDSDTPDTNPSNTVGDYWHYSSPYGISLSVGGFVFQTNPDNNIHFLVEILDDHTGQDTYLLRSYNNPPLSNGVHVEHVSWHLDDYSCNAVSSTGLPITPPVLEDWGQNYLRITFGYKGSSTIGARVTSAVPEPATLLLLALGSLALSRRRR